MPLTERQYLFAKYMLERIGFKSDDKIDKYLKKLESICGGYKYKIAYSNYGYPYKHYYYSTSECIEQLMEEIKIKENPEIIKDKISDSVNKYVSATDLSNFKFCPSSYSIEKSFEIEHPTNEDQRISGLELHKALRLIDKPIPKYYEQYDNYSTDIVDNEKIEKIRNCKLIFSGHNNEERFFKNPKVNFVGQPDYIFQDPNNDYFVVEEKYKLLKLKNLSDSFYSEAENEEIHNENQNTLRKYKKTFFDNHIVQVQSYIDYILDYDISYGVLIYWFYHLVENHDGTLRPFVFDFSLKVINENEFKKVLENTREELNDFISNRKMKFNTPSNPNKCAACVVNKYCSHKTDNFDSLNLPYNKKNLHLQYVSFPEELKKDNS